MTFTDPSVKPRQSRDGSTTLPRRAFMSMGLAAPLLGAGALSGCRRGRGSGGRKLRSDLRALPARLDRLEKVLEARGIDTARVLQPGLGRDEIRRRTASLPFALPEELYQLYGWHNGTAPGADLLLFRDQVFVDLDQAVRMVGQVNGFAGVRDAFPFATLEGAFYVLPTRKYALNSRLERPVVSVFEGVEVHFYSLGHMLDTASAWIQQGLHPSDQGVDRDAELAIWRQHNPGIFE